MSRQVHSLRYARLLSSLVGLLVVIIVMGACARGSWVSGGGFAANSNSHVNTMLATSSGQAWEVYDTPASLLNAYAMCLGF